MPQALDPHLFDACDADRSPLRVGGKWTAKVLICLESGPRRFGELQVPLRNVSAKVLADTLRSLERDGMVRRQVLDTGIPPHVEYELTSLGRSLFQPLAAHCEWSASYRRQLRAARASFDD